jgi:hypothetical protein
MEKRSRRRTEPVLAAKIAVAAAYGWLEVKCRRVPLLIRCRVSEANRPVHA